MNVARCNACHSKFCSTHWKELQAQFPHEPLTDLEKYCFSAAYLPKVLEHGLGIPAPHENVQITRELNGVSIDWALGAVLYEIMREQQHQLQQKEFAGAEGGVVGEAGNPTHQVFVTRPMSTAAASDSRSLVAVIGVGCVLLLAWLVCRSKQQSQRAGILPGARFSNR
jgi:hypothetical protein